MTTREAVLAELVTLERDWSHARLNAVHEGGWLPFHVRYFRGNGTLPEVRAVKVATVRKHLRALADSGHVVVVGLGGRGMAHYRPLNPLERQPGEGVRDWYERLRALAAESLLLEVQRAYGDALEAVRAQAE